MHDSELAQAISADGGLQQRIRGIIIAKAGVATMSGTERVMLEQVPINHVATAVAGNPSIFGSVKSALDPETPNVAEAINAGLVDSDLEFVVLTELSFLA